MKPRWDLIAVRKRDPLFNFAVLRQHTSGGRSSRPKQSSNRAWYETQKIQSMAGTASTLDQVLVAPCSQAC